MNQSQHIIKWRFIWVNIWIIGILYLIIYIGESQMFGTYYSAWGFGLFHVALGIYYYMKTRVYQFMLVGFVLGTGFWHYEAAEHMETWFSMYTFYFHLLAYFILVFTAMPVIVKAFKLEIQARKLFRLAAETIADTRDGYTERPYSGGNIDCTRDEIIGLGRFLAGKDIIRYKIENDTVTYGFSMNTSPLVDPAFQETSFVSISQAGHLSVRISKRDYKQYRKSFSFDQLCESFAGIFKGYIKHYQNNTENRIVYELKSI